MLEDSKIVINGEELKIIKHIGKGKGGNSYLAELAGKNVVYKKMHYEENATYTFEANKLQSELRDYKRMKAVGLALPELLFFDDERQFLVKQYIDGDTIAQIVARGELKDDYVVQMLRMCKQLYANGLNIDYFPPNFVVENDKLYYIDYECNCYMEEWNFEQWGVWFWANTSGMAKFMETGNHDYLSQNAKPHKAGLEEEVKRLLSLFA